MPPTPEKRMADAEFRWLVPADHPAFAGHFPGQPIVPGVLLLDRALAFAANLLPAPPAAWQVGNAKFLSPAGPGETLDFLLTVRANGSIAFTVSSGKRAVASGVVTPASR